MRLLVPMSLPSLNREGSIGYLLSLCQKGDNRPQGDGLSDISMRRSSRTMCECHSHVFVGGEGWGGSESIYPYIASVTTTTSPSQCLRTGPHPLPRKRSGEGL